MKKLNNKGYLLVEIIVSFVIAMGVAYFLAEITFNLKDRQEDLAYEMQYNVDKTLITKVILDDVYKYGVKEVKRNEINNDKLEFELTFNNDQTKVISITKSLIEYYDKNNIIDKYSKSFDTTLNVTLDTTNTKIDDINNILVIKTQAKALYSDKDYGLNLVIPY